MIDTWQAFVLALVQGLTEFLPVSSSAHLLFPSLLFGWPDQGLAFDVAVHFGTLMAVILYFRADLWILAGDGLRALSQQRHNRGSKEILFLALATVPAVLVGFFLNNHMESLRTLPVIATTTILFALLLAWADRKADRSGDDAVASWGAALLIGLAQAIAPVPGTSRSGITITAGLMLGLSRQAAARFSFLLSIPVILGAALLKFLELLEGRTEVDWTILGVGVGVAGVSAYLCIAVFLRLIDRVGMLPFVVYRLVLGVLLLLLLL